MLIWIKGTGRKFGCLIRWSEWFDSKLPFVVIAYFLLKLAYSEEDITAELALRVLAFSALGLGFGYAYNDWTDVELDRKAGKKNSVAKLSLPKVILLLGGLIVCSLLSLWPLLGQSEVLGAVVLAYALAVAYSSPTVRLKERGWLGLISSSIAQRCLPCWILFAACGRITELTAIYLMLMFVVGLRWMVTHQMEDYENDQISQTLTYARRVGYSKAQKWLPRFFLLELLLIACLTLKMGLACPMVLAIVGIYGGVTTFIALITGVTLWQKLKQPSSAYLVLTDLYFVYWPLGFCILLIIRRIDALLWFPFLVFWLRRYLWLHVNDLRLACKKAAKKI